MDGYQPILEISEIPPGERKIVTVRGKEIGIFNIEGTFHAFLNLCPHMGAPLCKGRLEKEMCAQKPGTFIPDTRTVLRCPWHRWEFDIESGKSIFNDSVRVKKFPIKIKADTIYCKI